MRDMNDDLIVTILVRISISIGVLVSTTGHSKEEYATSAALCTGIFNDVNQIMDSEIYSGKLPAPYGFILWSLSVVTLFFMASVTITTRKRNNESTTILQRPKDLESMLLNFALLILLLINVIGYRIYWRE
jgi:hypothetical protein